MNYINEYIEEEYNFNINKNYKSDKELEVAVIKNGYVLPAKKELGNKCLCGKGGVLTEKLDYVELSAMLGENMSDRLNGKYSFEVKDVEYIDEKVIYINHFIKHWGHYLLDVIGRLWYVLENELNEYKFVYTTELGKENKITGNYLELLLLLGIEEEKLIMVNKVCRFKEIIIPESSIYPGKYYTSKYINIFDCIINKIVINQKENYKIYCTRKNLLHLGMREIGEESIKKVFEDNKFKIVSLENMSLTEQIKLLNSSSEIYTISGTLPHNILFIKNKVKLIILNKTYRLNRHQFLLNNARKNVEVEYVDINVSPLPVVYGKGPFIMKITEKFSEYCNNNNIKLNYSVNEKLKLKEKIWYYLNYLISYKGFLAKDDMVDYKKLRKYYKKSQRICK